MIPEMRKGFTEEQTMKILQEHAEGKTVGGVCRRNGISKNERLKRLVAELSLENMIWKDVIKNFSGLER